MNKKKIILLIFLLLIIFTIFRFIYRNGPGRIKECNYNSEKVYTVANNAYDSNEGIVDKNGKSVGSCGYLDFNSGGVPCNDLKQCSVIYAVPNNIYGEPITFTTRALTLVVKMLLKSF